MGFAAETQDIVANARHKLARKGVPLMVANHGPSTFGSDHNSLVLVDAEGERGLPAADKLTLARQLVAHIAERAPAGKTSSTFTPSDR